MIRIFANGKTLHEDVSIVTADAIGPLRARFFCLPGGAPGALGGHFRTATKPIDWTWTPFRYCQSPGEPCY